MLIGIFRTYTIVMLNRRTSLILLFTLFTFFAQARVKTGIEVLRADDFQLLKGKRIGLITNPTGVDANLKSTVDILFEADSLDLVALYAPEHGVRGDVHAGDKVASSVDKKTGLPMYSLYGKTRKPTKEMLKAIDVLVYDIQDIGCRSYTYISTLGLVMQAAAENEIEVVVLDRPNPLGGYKVEGNLVEDDFISFVSQFKIPYIYGLTCGELALMLNDAVGCELSVVPMENWLPSMTFEDTGLPWVPTSPHIPQAQTCMYYPATGIMGELGMISVGVGYTLPFQLMGAEWVNAADLAKALNALALPGVMFRPIYFKPFYAFGKSKQLEGVQLQVLDYDLVRLSELQFYVVQELYRLYPSHPMFSDASKGRFAMFDKVCGSDSIRVKFSKDYQFNSIKSYWRKDEADFVKRATPFYLY